MLVHLKEPMGSSTIDGHRVYGRFYAYGSFGPTHVSREVYFLNKQMLEEAEITSEWLTKKTGRQFPKVTFKTTEFHTVDFELIKEMGRLLGIKYVGRKKTTKVERAAFRRAVVVAIESLR